MRRRAAQQKLRFISWKTKKNRDKTLKNELAAWTMAYKWLENAVAPLAGAWIEIQKLVNNLPTLLVAPLAGAWIGRAYYLLLNHRPWNILYLVTAFMLAVAFSASGFLFLTPFLFNKVRSALY